MRFVVLSGGEGAASGPLPPPNLLPLLCTPGLHSGDKLCPPPRTLAAPSTAEGIPCIPPGWGGWGGWSRAQQRGHVNGAPVKSRLHLKPRKQPRGDWGGSLTHAATPGPVSEPQEAWASLTWEAEWVHGVRSGVDSGSVTPSGLHTSPVRWR